MAQVPETPGMQVMPTIMGYRPMSDSIPKVPSMGIEQGLEKASNRIDRMFTKFLDEQDDARVTEAVAELQRRATQMQTEEGGWASKFGTNATTPDEQGRGLVEQVDTALQEYGSELSARLTPRQQRKFSPRALGIYQQNYGNVSQHVLQQGLQNRITAQTSYISALEESGAANYNRPEQLAQALEGINAAQDTLGGYKGLPAETVAMLKRQSADRLYGNAIDQYLSKAEQDPSMAVLADGILRANGKHMTGSTVTKYRRQIDGYTKLMDIRTDVDNASAYAGTLTRGGDLAVLTKDGSLSPQQAATEAGRTVSVLGSLGGNSQLAHDLTDTAGNGANYRYGFSKMRIGDAYDAAKKSGLYSGSLADFSTRFMNDKGFNVQVATRAADDAIRGYAGDMTKVFASLRVGRDAVDKAVAEADKTGQPWLNALSEKDRQWVAQAVSKFDKQGQLLDVKDANGKPMRITDPQFYTRAYEMPNEQDIRKYVRKTCPRAQWDINYENTVVSSVMAREKDKMEAWTAAHKRDVAAAIEAVYASKGDLSGLTPLMGKLALKEQEEVEQTAKKLRSADASVTDLRVQALYSDPKVLKSLTEDDLILLRSQFSQPDFNKLVTDWSAVKLAEGEAQDQAIVERNLAQRGFITDKAAQSISHEAVRTALMTEYPDFAKCDKEVQGLLIEGVRRFLSTAPLDSDKEVMLNGSINISTAIRRYVKPQMLIRERYFLPDKKVDALLLDPAKDFDSYGIGSNKQIIEALARMRYGLTGPEKPTDLQMRNTWIDLNLQKTPSWFRMREGNVPLFLMDQKTVTNLKKAASAEGVKLDGADLVRAYMFTRLNPGGIPTVDPVEEPVADPEIMEQTGADTLTAVFGAEAEDVMNNGE